MNHFYVSFGNKNTNSMDKITKSFLFILQNIYTFLSLISFISDVSKRYSRVIKNAWFHWAANKLDAICLKVYTVDTKVITDVYCKIIDTCQKLWFRTVEDSSNESLFYICILKENFLKFLIFIAWDHLPLIIQWIIMHLHQV